MEYQDVQKEKSKYGVQYTLLQEVEEDNAQKIYEKDMFIRPFYSQWNGNLKLSYPTKGMQEIEAYFKGKEEAERSRISSELWHVLDNMSVQQQECLDLEELYVDRNGTVFLIYLPGVRISDEIDLKNWKEKLEGAIIEGTEERTVAHIWHEKTKDSLTLRSTNSANCFVMEQDTAVLGKSEERADLVIRGSVSVSRRHCRIIKKQNRYYVEDLGSLNHTYKNGILLEPGEQVEISMGDALRLSDIEFSVEG